MADFHCSPETITMWLSGYFSIQKKKFRKRKKKVCKEASKERESMGPKVKNSTGFFGSVDSTRFWISLKEALQQFSV